MGYKTPKDVAKAGIATGATKAKLSWDKALVAGFLAGAYIGIAGLLAIVVSAGMPKEWGGLPEWQIFLRALGFDHVVANMFFLPAAIFAGVPDLTWWDAIHNWIFAFIGNVVGATLFVSGAYWFLYAREIHEEPGDTPSGAQERPERREPVGAR